MLSLHNLKIYKGWHTGFRDDLTDMVRHLFDRVHSPRVTRIGLRYLNALTPNKHSISSASDLQISLLVAGAVVADNFNVNYREMTHRFHAVTRISTPDFVQGRIPADLSVFVDVDVYTPDELDYSCVGSVLEWLDDAHDVEKGAFFRLIPQPILDRIVEE